MAECQIVFIGGRPKQAITKRGREYTRKGYDLEVSKADKFKRKCSFLGYSETQVIEKLVDGFLAASGAGEEVKEAGSLWDRRASEHIKEGVQRAFKEIFLFNTN